MHYLMIYHTAPDYLARRGEFRNPHLALAWAAVERGELILGGAAGDPIDCAVLLFRCDSPAVPEAFARADPYVLNGVVTSWKIMPWHTVAGHDANQPVRGD